MKQNSFIFEIGELVRGNPGTRFIFEIDEKDTIVNDEEYTTLSDITGRLRFTKLNDGILVEMLNVKLKLKFKCTKCGDEFNKVIEVPTAERLFFFEEQKHILDVMDVFYVDLKKMEIDTADFIRQEIILHFPMIPVCSNSCKGLCPKCGTNLNQKSCNCKIDSKPDKPLEILKQLYNG